MRICLPMTYATDEERMRRRFQEFTSLGEFRLWDTYTKKTYFIDDRQSDKDTVVLQSIS